MFCLEDGLEEEAKEAEGEDCGCQERFGGSTRTPHGSLGETAHGFHPGNWGRRGFEGREDRVLDIELSTLYLLISEKLLWGAR